MANQDFRVKNGLQVGRDISSAVTVGIGTTTAPTSNVDIQGTVSATGTITAPTFAGTATTANNLSDAANITTGTISADRLSGTYDINITGSIDSVGETIGISTISVYNNLNSKHLIEKITSLEKENEELKNKIKLLEEKDK